MPRKAKGSCYEKDGRWYVAVTLSATRRPHVPMPACKERPEAEARTQVINELAQKLRASGHANTLPDLTERFLRSAGEADVKKLASTVATVDALCRGEVTPKRSAMMDLTIQQIGDLYTKNTLARDYPLYVRPMKSAEKIASTLAKHIYPVVGPVLVRDFTLATGDALMATVPTALQSHTRIRIAKQINRLLNLAVHPLRIISHNPLTKGWVPKTPKDEKARSCLYPDEDAQLLRCQTVPLEHRIIWGYLHREGNRHSEAAGYTWSDFDLRRGVTNLDENKTRSPRFWALQPDVVRSLRAIRRYREHQLGRPIEDNEPIFVESDGASRVDSNGAAKRYRVDLKTAGIDRPQLYAHHAHRGRVRAHDTRAAFTTIALANGSNETWIMDRTGHTTSRQLHEYRRRARSYVELNLGPWLPMDQLIPELAPFCDAPARVQPAPASTANGATQAFAAPVAEPGSAPDAPPGAGGPVLAAAEPSSLPASRRGSASASGDLSQRPKRVRQSQRRAIVEDSVDADAGGSRRRPSSAERFASGFKKMGGSESRPTIRPHLNPDRILTGGTRAPNGLEDRRFTTETRRHGGKTQKSPCLRVSVVNFCECRGVFNRSAL